MRLRAAVCATIATLVADTPPAGAHALTGAVVAPQADTRAARRAICTVFGRWCGQALRVSWCESRWDVYARNGEYLGLFQTGSYARSRYGFSWEPWGQSRAAFRYFRASGYTWRAWTCGWAA